MKNLVSRYHGALLRFFHKHAQNYWDAEELAQEVFCKIVKRDDIDDKRNQEAYLYTVAWSVLRDKVRTDRSRKRSHHVSFDEEHSPAVHFSVDHQIDSENRYRCFIEVLNQLDLKTREIFLLNRYHGVTYSDIAVRYAISVSSVEKHMMKALASIKREVKES